MPYNAPYGIQERKGEKTGDLVWTGRDVAFEIFLKLCNYLLEKAI
jgi:hypothetical protein